MFFALSPSLQFTDVGKRCDQHHDVREGLINLRFHSEICFSGDTQVKLGRHPLVRGHLQGGGHRVMARGWLPAPRSLRPCHEPPRDIEIR